MATDSDINKYYEVAITLVERAGVVIRAAIDNRDKNVSEKLSPTDLVTETDNAVEKLLVDGLKCQFPDHQFIGEEGIAAGSGYVTEFTDKPTWIIDPIDGTMNFVHSNPMVSISVALAIGRRLVLGIISAPCLGKTYSAIKGRGATLNGKPMKVSKCTELGQAMAILEVWARDGAASEAKQVENFASILPKVHSLRSLGSAAIDLAFIAAGQSDIYQHSGIHCWDIAAGAVIVHEAGGVVLDPSGKDFDFMSRGILVASTSELVKEWRAKIDFKRDTFPRDFPDVCPM